MSCFLDCAKAENVSENWGTSSPTSLNLMNLVISKNVCGQDALSHNNLPRESRLESLFDPVFQSSHIGDQKMNSEVETGFTTKNLKV